MARMPRSHMAVCRGVMSERAATYMLCRLRGCVDGQYLLHVAMPRHEAFLVRRDAWCQRVAFNAASVREQYSSLTRIDPSAIVPLNSGAGAHCRARTEAGVAGMDGACADLGVGASGRWRQLHFLPAATDDAAEGAGARGDELRAVLHRLQFGGGCSSRPAYTVSSLVSIGFCATLEHMLLALARAASVGSRLVLGRRSGAVWSSGWLCGRERSLTCYFNVTSTCCADEESFEAAERDRGSGGGLDAKAGKGWLSKQRMRMLTSKLSRATAGVGRAAAGAGADPAEPREHYGNSRALSLGGDLGRRYNLHGTAWVQGQLARWLFDRMLPGIRDEVDRRRGTVLPRLGGAAARDSTARRRCIGMHVRRGDSCALGSRFCPANRTRAYFEAAAALRAKYGLTRLVLATDDAAAASLCRARVLGFECATMAMDRARFASHTSIERRVVHHTRGGLSGSAVALDALADVEMLSECEAHVLVLRSAVSRLAYALSVARKGRHAPLISLQWPWGGMPGPPE